MIDLLRQLPKSELHVHVRGAIPIGVFTHLLNKYPISDVLAGISDEYKVKLNGYPNMRPFLSDRHTPWTVEDAAKIFEFRTFEQFLDTFNFTGFFLREVADMRALVLGVVESLKAQNIIYAEITISIKEYLRQHITLEDLLTCLEEASHVPGIRVQWIVDLVRDFGVESGLTLLHQILELRPTSIVGITLGGSEHEYPPAQFIEIYKLARDNALHLTVHAGEALGPESVWDAVRVLGVERIGHGVRAIEDPALVAYLAEKEIPLEVCPTSNLRTCIYPSYAAHPVLSLYEAGVPVSINSDDPTFFHTTLANEYEQVYNMGANEAAIYSMLRNGFAHAFLDKREISVYQSQLDAEWRRIRG